MPDRRATFAHLLEMKGPAITAIANEMGISPETARYWYKSIVSHRGMALQAVIDEGKLGLKRVFTIADLDERCRPHAREIFRILVNYLGLGYYIRLEPSGKFSMRYLVPAGRGEEELLHALDLLKQEGIFRAVTVAPMEWRLFVPMRTHYYNFSKWVWEFDWSDVISRKEEELQPPPAPSGLAKFDFSDLLIMKELQTDAARSLRAIARQLRMEYDAAFTHYHHVLKQQLIVAYRIRWVESSLKDPGVRSVDALAASSHQAQHKYATASVLVTGLSEGEELNVMGAISRIPFLFNMQGGNGNLSFEAAIPFSYQADTLHFLREVLSPYRDSMDFSFTDQTFAKGATLPFDEYDAETETWDYRAKECAEAFKDFLPKLQRAQEASGL